jgi:hypothetical protein
MKAGNPGADRKQLEVGIAICPEPEGLFTMVHHHREEAGSGSGHTGAMVFATGSSKLRGFYYKQFFSVKKNR